MGTKKIILDYMDKNLEKIFEPISEEYFNEIEEIRLRALRPVIIKHKSEEVFLQEGGIIGKSLDNAYKATTEQILNMLELMANRSLYAFSEEIKSGYITLPGGHRVGFTGKAVTEGNSVKTIKNFNGLNIRISHEIKGCGENVAKHLFNKGRLLHTVIISPPSCGKTTLLRDIVRLISNGFEGVTEGLTVSVIDERSEIAGCYMGLPQNDIGIRTDVLDGGRKAEGMLMVLRAMAPKVIAVDEIGKREDINAIGDVINAGVAIICTVHGSGIDDLRQKPVLCELIEKNVFKRFVTLKGRGEISGIYNEHFINIHEGGQGK